jgi:hypothetical protein
MTPRGAFAVPARLSRERLVPTEGAANPASGHQSVRKIPHGCGVFRLRQHLLGLPPFAIARLPVRRVPGISSFARAIGSEHANG